MDDLVPMSFPEENVLIGNDLIPTQNIAFLHQNNTSPPVLIVRQTHEWIELTIDTKVHFRKKYIQYVINDKPESLD